MILVLLAEDDDKLIGRYTTELQMEGFTVVHTSKGSDIAKIVEVHKPQIIVSDTQLKEMDGDTACRSLFEQGKIDKILIIAMSKVLDNDEYWEGLCHAFYQKKKIYDLGRETKFLYEDFRRNPNMPRYKVFPKT
jgi:DNA-binding response OmpR family regulator